jgi:hypothetical protein
MLQQMIIEVSKTMTQQEIAKSIGPCIYQHTISRIIHGGQKSINLASWEKLKKLHRKVMKKEKEKT